MYIVLTCCQPRLLISHDNYKNTVMPFFLRVYYIVKKVEGILEKVIKTQRKSRGIALLFLQPQRSVGGKRDVLPTGMTRYPLCRRLGGCAGPVWTGAKNIPPPGIRSQNSQARSESLYLLGYRGPPIPYDQPISELAMLPLT